MRTIENQWKSMKSNGKHMETIENQWKQLKFNENPWKLMNMNRTNENQWNSMNINQKARPKAGDGFHQDLRQWSLCETAAERTVQGNEHPQLCSQRKTANLLVIPLLFYITWPQIRSIGKGKRLNPVLNYLYYPRNLKVNSFYVFY